MGLSKKDLWRYLLSNGVNTATCMGVWRFNSSHRNGMYLVLHPSQQALAERYRVLAGSLTCCRPHMEAEALLMPLFLLWNFTFVRRVLVHVATLLCLRFFLNIVKRSMEGASKVALGTRASYIFWEQDNYLPKQLSSLWRRSGQGYFFKLATNGDLHLIMRKHFSNFCFPKFYQ